MDKKALLVDLHMRLANAKLSRRQLEGKLTKEQLQEMDQKIKSLQDLIWVIEADL